MNAMHQQVYKYKSVNWLLIAAVIVATFLPAHYHLHHLDDADASSHMHAIDLHLMTDAIEHSHHNSGTTSFTAVPDNSVKSSSINAPVILPGLLLILLPIIAIRINIRPAFRSSGLKQTDPHFSPLLRAPPLI